LTIATAFTDKAVTVKARRANAMFVRRRTAACEDTHQKSVSALRKYTKHNLTQTKTIIATLRTGINNI
jgi:hypothetical protein